MRKGLTKLQRNIITFILCVLFVISVFIIFKVTVGKNLKELKQQNSELQSKYDMLEIYIADMPRYRSEIKTLRTNIEDIIDSFGANTSSASILHNYETLFKKQGLVSSSLTYEHPQVLNTVNYTDTNEGEITYDLQQTNINVSYSDSYDGLMKFFRGMKEDGRNECISTINISPNSEGNVNGSFQICKYTIFNENRTEETLYEDLDGIKVGAQAALTGVTSKESLFKMGRIINSSNSSEPTSVQEEQSQEEIQEEQPQEEIQEEQLQEEIQEEQPQERTINAHAGEESADTESQTQEVSQTSSSEENSRQEEQPIQEEQEQNEQYDNPFRNMREVGFYDESVQEEQEQNEQYDNPFGNMEEVGFYDESDRSDY